MKLLDIIFALICGEASTLLINDLFLNHFPGAGFLQFLSLFLIPILAILFLWLADRFSKKFFFIWQLAKHLLVGLLVVLVDLRIFIFLINLTTTYSAWISGTAKAISFLISVSSIKFFGNKYWAFEERKRNGLAKQFAVFITVTLIGLVIDVGSFLFLTKFMIPQFGFSTQAWVKAGVVLAAVVAAVWNFITYKFIVFKKENVISAL